MESNPERWRASSQVLASDRPAELGRPMRMLGSVVHAYIGAGSHSLFQRLARCMSVSVITTIISLLTLATATVAFGVQAWIANVIATAVATGPSYSLNRRWTWGRTDASDPWREVLPFWALSFAGLALSTIAVWVADAWAAGAQLAPAMHTITLLLAHLFGFGVLWVAQFILLDRVLFGRDVHRDRKTPRLEVAEASSRRSEVSA